MSLILDYPTETQQMKVIAAENQLADLRVYIPDAEDIDYTDDTMIVFSDTRHAAWQNVVDFSHRVGDLFRKRVYVSGPMDELDTPAFWRAHESAEAV